ncbi:MAG: ROK family transcriptional regulator [Trueperaceae bacterium]
MGREQIRSLNQRAVLSAIHRHGRISRSDLAVELSLSPAAVSAITGVFIDAGLVIEAEVGISTSVGRKPILLEINYDHAFVFGVKVTSKSLITALTNLKAEPLDCRIDPLENLAADSVIAAIAEATEQLLTSTGVRVARVAGLGVSLPGIVEQETGKVRYSPLLDWYQVPFAERLEEKLSLPVLIENDVNALAAAQAWFGHGHQHDAFLVVTLGRGVGMGIVIGGQVYRGPRGGAGELGHTLVTPPEPRVMEPKPATLEGLLSDDALIEQARKAGAKLGANAVPEQLTALAQGNDPIALSLFGDAGKLLGTTLANLVNIFAPSLIVISGEGVRNAEYFMPTACEALKRHSFGDVAADLELVVDDWGDDAWARGAAGLAAARFLGKAAIPLDSALSTPTTRSRLSGIAKGG